MDEGWIKLHRSALECAQFQDDWLWRLWCWCLLKARYSPREVGNTVIPRGSFVTGKLRAAEELGVHPSRWFRGIHTLAESPYFCIHILANRERTMITVCNYDTYQDDAVTGEPPANHERTASEPPANPYKESKEGKNGRKKEKTKAASPLPPEGWLPPVQLNTPRFVGLWTKWEVHRRAKKASLTDGTREMQLVSLAKIGEAHACEILEHTLSNGWQGLRDIDGKTLSEVVKNGVENPLDRIGTKADARDYPKGATVQ